MQFVCLLLSKESLLENLHSLLATSAFLLEVGKDIIQLLRVLVDKLEQLQDVRVLLGKSYLLCKLVELLRG